VISCPRFFLRRPRSKREYIRVALQQCPCSYFLYLIFFAEPVLIVVVDTNTRKYQHFEIQLYIRDTFLEVPRTGPCSEREESQNSQRTIVLICMNAAKEQCNLHWPPVYGEFFRTCLKNKSTDQNFTEEEEDDDEDSTHVDRHELGEIWRHMIEPAVHLGVVGLEFRSCGSTSRRRWTRRRASCAVAVTSRSVTADAIACTLCSPLRNAPRPYMKCAGACPCPVQCVATKGHDGRANREQCKARKKRKRKK
jgi:hypothetical protein